jgi:hypothetical protein
MVLLVSIFSTTQIMVNSLHLLPMQGSKKSALASSPVLDYLLPELSVWQTGEIRQKQPLENIDTYMLQETRLILKRVRSFCFRLMLTDSTRFNIKLQANGSRAVLLVTGTFEEKEKLTQMINQDNWLSSAFNWLCPNYHALAHSQELINFSYLYEKDRQQALHQYRHFDQTEQGMCCYLACDIDKGEPILTWRLESPKTVYMLKELHNKV